MSAATEQLQANLREGRHVADALKRATLDERRPGGRYAGVTDADIDALAERYAELAIRHSQLVEQIEAAGRTRGKSAGRVLARAAVGVAFEVARRHSLAASAAIWIGTHAAHEAIKVYAAREAAAR
jgi:hypothetical protein